MKNEGEMEGRIEEERMEKKWRKKEGRLEE